MLCSPTQVQQTEFVIRWATYTSTSVDTVAYYYIVVSDIVLSDVVAA